MPLSLDGTTGISASGNITGGNVIASGSLIVGSFSPSSLSTAGNVTGGNILTGGLVSATGNIISPIHVSTANVTLTSTAANAWVILTPTGTGTIIANKDITNGQASGTGNIGASGATFNTIFAKATSAQYADLAEMYLGDANLYPGSVVEFAGEKEITLSTSDHSPRVAGIISTRPSHLMNAALSGEHAYAVALTGRVPCTVIGRISKGDCLVSSNHPGAAMRLDPAKWVPGCLLGKALENHDSDSIGVIEVAVGRF